VKFSTTNYANWQAIVDKLQATPANVIAYYRVDLAINKVAEAWMVASASAPFVVYGEFGNQGPTAATLIGKYTGAAAVTTTIGVSES